MIKWLNSFQPTAALLLRLVVAACMFHYGYAKVVPKGALDNNAHFIATQHLPYWLGYVSAITEFVGGILLFFGLLTRMVCLLITINMLFAFFLAGLHGQPSMYYFQLALAAGALMLVTTGPGALAVDRKLGLA